MGRASTSPAPDHCLRKVLTPEAMVFVARLQRAFGGRRAELLARRGARQRELDAGKRPDFLAETARSAKATGTARRCRRTSQDRRVEITGPVDRKMIINALNSGAKVFMADFEDANTPTWDNTSRARSTCATRCGARSTTSRPKASTTR